jgi:translation elongation factor EF-G
MVGINGYAVEVVGVVVGEGFGYMVVVEVVVDEGFYYAMELRALADGGCPCCIASL